MDRILWLAVLSLVLCTGCPSGESSSSQSGSTDAAPVNIVTTTGMVADLVRNVAGERAQVTGIMGEGVDPHLFRPTSRDISQLLQADIVFYSGLRLEGAMQTALERAAGSGKHVVAVTEDLPHDLLRTSPDFPDHPDPHVWGDAALWSRCLEVVVRVMSEALPEHAEEFEANAADYRKELLEIDEYARKSIATIPEDSRYLVTAHDAFAYFSKAYGIEERSVQGITTESEPGVQDINQLVDFLVKNKVPAIFVEATVNEANLRAVMEGAANRGWKVTIGGTLFSDSMGQPGTYEGTYIGMMDHNITTITRALHGEAPERGLHGKLAAPSAAQ